MDIRVTPTVSLVPAERLRGFTMVETLVALVVLAVGMLGVASLFVASLNSASSAIGRMQAVNLATDIADRIRANRRAGGAYAAAGADNGCVGSAAVSCTAAQMAATDVFLWQRQLSRAFGGAGATGTITFAAGTPASYTIVIGWTEKTVAQQYTLLLQVPTS